MTTAATVGADSDSTTLPADVADWIPVAAGGVLKQAQRRPGGGRKEAWFVDVELPDGTRRELFLRLDRSDTETSGDPFTLQREACFYAALQGTEVMVPPLVGVHPTEQAMLTERISGDTWFGRLTDGDEKLAIARDFMPKLAALHRLDPTRLDLLGQSVPRDLPEAVEREIALWEGLYRHGDYPPDALLEFGFRWLRRHRPEVTGPVVIVQGDTGPGNFLFRDRKVTTVLDWELAHWGDPMDDIAWLSLRAVQDPFTHLPDRLREYEQLSGIEIDDRRVRYYRVFAELRIVVLNYRRRQQPDPLAEVGNGLIYGALHDRLYAETLADYHGVGHEPPAPLEGELTDRDRLYDAALTQLREIVVPAIDDPFATLRAKGIARMLKHLREADRVGAAAESAELEDIAELLGERHTSLRTARAALADAVVREAVDEMAMVRYAVRRTAYETQLTRSAMGALADRHYDPLR